MTTLLDIAALAAHPLPWLPAGGDKEDRGTVLVAGGDMVMAGASILAGVSALRVGAGKLQIRADRAAAPAMAVAVPEARIVVSSSTSATPLMEPAASASALVRGPGTHSGDAQRRLAFRLLTHADQVSAVVDAGALPVRDDAARFAEGAKGRTVLTPHAGEMASMLGCDKEAIKADPLAAGREAASMFHSVVVMKGATTFVISPDGTAWRRRSRPPGRRSASWRESFPTSCRSFWRGSAP